MTDAALLATERRALALLDELLDVPDALREEWITRFSDDESVADRLRAMAEADRIATLRTGGAAALGGAASGPPPDRVGRYRLTGLVGRGGMGAVWRAERDAGDFAHEVAVKLIKPGLIGDALSARFAIERQTLAGLNHPNIARLYDGGETADGQPYIVMELIDGVAIDRWADAHGLDAAGRRRMVRAVALAVAHAHARLVTHRDITPMNVLVTADGTPKLIDFGIARPADADDAPTATDIAGLGRLLGRLLPRPTADEAAIIARATAEDDRQRYPTAQALADDLAALDAGRPVAAMAGGRWYRWRKFVARNRAGVAAGAIALLALLGGLAVSQWSLVRANKARTAEAERFDELRRLAGFMVFDLNDRLHRVPGTTASRAALVGEAQAYLTRLSETAGAARDVRLDTARGLLRLAEVQASPAERNLGEVEAAQANLARARAILSGLDAEAAGDPAVTVERARLDAVAALFAIHHDRKGEDAAKLLAAAERGIETVPPGGRDMRWHLARRDIGRAALELWATDEKLDRLDAEARAHAARAAAWPPPLAASATAAIEQAHARYALGLVQSLRATGDHGAALLLDSHRLFAGAERAQRDNPNLLYMIGWSGLDAYASMQRAGRMEEAEAPLLAATRAIERLVELDPVDRSSARLARNAGETLAQHLSNTGCPVEAIAAQRAVIARTKAGVTNLPDAHSRADLGFNYMILGLIAKKAGDRGLTCASWQTALGDFRAVAAEGRLIGFHAGFLPGLERNVEGCRAGLALAALGPLRYRPAGLSALQHEAVPADRPQREGEAAGQADGFRRPALLAHDPPAGAREDTGPAGA